MVSNIVYNQCIDMPPKSTMHHWVKERMWYYLKRHKINKLTPPSVDKSIYVHSSIHPLGRVEVGGGVAQRYILGRVSK